MSLDGSGGYDLPAGQPVVTGTTISSATHNTLASDLATALDTALYRDGQATLTANLLCGNFALTSARLRAIDGTVGAPGISFQTETDCGFWIPTTNSVALSTAGVEAIRVDASQRLLVGHTAAITLDTSLVPHNQVVGSSADTGSIGLATFSADANGSYLRMVKSRHATKGSHTVVQSGDNLGGIGFAGSDGTNFELAAAITADVDGTPGNNDMPGRLMFFTTPDGSVSASEVMRIDRTQRVGIGNTNPAGTTAKLSVIADSTSNTIQVEQTGTTAAAVIAKTTSNSYAGTEVAIQANTAAGTGFTFLLCQSDVDGTPDSEFTLRGDGNSFQDGGTAWGTPADYAEYFESADGQPISFGTTVVLEGDKVRAATAVDQPGDIMGVVRPKQSHVSIVANAAPLKWSNKYLRDVDDGYLMEDYQVFSWEDFDENGRVVKNHSYASYKMPAGVAIPSHARVVTQQKRKLNPAWSPNIPYIARADRPEWNVIGLVGQVKLRFGQPTNPRWRKMKDLANRELWFIR